MNETQKTAKQAILKAIAFHPYSPQQTELLIEGALRAVHEQGRLDGIKEAYRKAEDVIDGVFKDA